MTKVVYNACYGGFSLSAKAVRRGKELSPADKHWQSVCEKYGFFEGERHDATLVRVVEEFGREASGDCARLAVAEIPDGTAYRIDEYDGSESVETRDSYNWITP
jgi:hypothetical protein